MMVKPNRFLEKGEGPEIPSHLLPNTGRETQLFEERWGRAKNEVIELLSPFEGNALDENEHIKYLCKVDPVNPENNFCTCQDMMHRNKVDYHKTHGVAYLCKHLMRLIQIRLSWVEKSNAKRSDKSCL